MIRFIDIDSGNVYNGSKPYVFWMDKQQSTQLIYVKKICVLTDQKVLTISIPENSVFRLLDMSRLNEISDVEINEFSYKDLSNLVTNEYESEGYNYNPNFYIHMIYITAQSENIGEFHEDFILSWTNEHDVESENFEIASDFYAENESLKINLANFGEEIPETIQSAIYDTNVHEESKDNITLNRKYKELLLNYWNIVAGRGSYQSLIDSLNWFEYGDLVKINEIWKHKKANEDIFNREELNKIMTEKIRSTLSNFSKTTYIGLYLALQKYLTQDGKVQYDILNNMSYSVGNNTDFISAQTDRLIPNNNPDKNWLFTINEDNVTIDEYEDSDEVIGPGSNWIRPDNENYEGFIGEEVPILKDISFKWSVEDLSLKMYLLGSFYEAYFMPIHLDLLHSTIEELVFTNTIKCMNITHLDRLDYLYNTQSFSCNIKDNSTYKLDDVQVQAGVMTEMSHTYNEDDSYDDFVVFGVSNEYNQPMELDDESSSDDVVNNRLKTFMLNNYNGIGVIIPFHCEIPAEEGDFINFEMIRVAAPNKDNTLYNYTLYQSVLPDNYYYIDFNLLLTDEGENVVTLYFSTAGGRSFTKTLHINILGDVYCKLKVYKVKSSEELQGLNANDYDITKIQTEENKEYVRDFNKYFFSHVRDSESNVVKGYTKVFIPGVYSNSKLDDGVKYNKIIVFDASVNLSDVVVNNIQQIFNIFEKNVTVDNTEKKYYILVSKMFIEDMESYETDTIQYILNNIGSYLVREDTGFFYQHHYLEELHGDSIQDYIITKKDTLCVVPECKYSKLTLDDTEWEFINVSTINKETYKFKSIKEPFIGKDIDQHLSPGYYNVKFIYKVGDQTYESELDSTFLVAKEKSTL